MSRPDDDDKTLGLPQGARDMLQKEVERQKKLEEQGAAVKAAPATTPKPRPVVPPPKSPQSSTHPAYLDDPCVTIPPAGGSHSRKLPGLTDPREDRPPSGLEPSVRPWDEGSAASPPWGARPPDPKPEDPVWTIDGPPAVDSPVWADGSDFDIPCPPPPGKPPTRPKPVPVDAGSDPWGTGTPSTPVPGPLVQGPVSPPTYQPARPAPYPPDSTSDDDDRPGQTVAIKRDIHAYTSQKALLTLQFLNTSLGRWADLGKILGGQREIGRPTFRDWTPNSEDLAEHHVRLVVTDDGVEVHPLRSLNGVYLRLKPHSPVELTAETRIRIGRHVLEYRPGLPACATDSLQSDDGEVFQARVLEPLGFIDLIGPDGLAYLSHPLTKPDEPGTRICRGGPECDLALTGDDSVSSMKHARIFYSAGVCRLEDLKSTNGTFVQITEPVQIRCGNTRDQDSGDVVAIGGYLIRVVEERAGAGLPVDRPSPGLTRSRTETPPGRRP